MAARRAAGTVILIFCFLISTSAGSISAVPITVTMEVKPSESPSQWSLKRPGAGKSIEARIVQRAAHVPGSWTKFAVCVLDRESGGTLARQQSGVGALNSGTESAAGRWQFLPAWRHGLPYMIRDRLVQFGMSPKAAAKVRKHLHALRLINRYPGIFQDIGFNEVIERGGSFHWILSGSRCNNLVP